MRKGLLLLLLLSPFAAFEASAQIHATQILCEDCRDPLRYPADWANHAYNQVFGDEGHLSFDEADDFWLYNLRGDRVYVDIDWNMTGLNILGQKLPMWPTNRVKISLGLPDGTIVEYFRYVFHDSLPVPAPPGSEDNADPNDDTSGDESGNEGVDDEPEGWVEIVAHDHSGHLLNSQCKDRASSLPRRR